MSKLVHDMLYSSGNLLWIRVTTIHILQLQLFTVNHRCHLHVVLNNDKLIISNDVTYSILLSN